MSRLRNTWQLAKISWTVLRKDRELLWIPVLSLLVSATVLGVAVLAARVVTVGVVTMSTTGVDKQAAEATDPATIVVSVIATLALGVITVFFKGVLVAGAHERMTGGDPTVRSAVSGAWARIGGLVPWAIVTVTVGLVFKVLRALVGGWLRRLAIRVVRIAWEVVTFLAVPAIVIEKLGAIDGMKRSAKLLGQTWGENLAARVGFGLLGLLLVIPAPVVAGLLAASGVRVLTVVGIIAAVVWLLVVTVVLTALSAIFQTALYLYATTGRPPAGFEQAPLAQSFATRVGLIRRLRRRLRRQQSDDLVSNDLVSRVPSQGGGGA